MLKSKLIKLTVAAVLALPAVPMFGKTVHHKLTHSTRTHRLLVARSHRLTAKGHRHLSLSSRRTKLSHRTKAGRLSKTHRLVRETSLRNASTPSSTFKVHVTKMPPTIDGLNT